MSDRRTKNAIAMAGVKLDASKVLAALKKGPLREPAHVWLYNVRNGTGYRGRTRYADAVVMSVWPSRGIWRGGIEVKVDRGDWLKELDQPEKAGEVQKFCEYWWVAAPEGVVKVQEVPKNWGFFEIKSGKVSTAKVAPSLVPAALTYEFVASLVRNEAKDQQKRYNEGWKEGFDDAVAQYGEEAQRKLYDDMLEAKRALDREQSAHENARHHVTQLTNRIADFEEATGVDLSALKRSWCSEGEARTLAGQFAAAKLLAQHPPERLAEAFQNVATALRAIPEPTTEKENE